MARLRAITGMVDTKQYQNSAGWVDLSWKRTAWSLCLFKQHLTMVTGHQHSVVHKADAGEKIHGSQLKQD